MRITNTLKCEAIYLQAADLRAFDQTQRVLRELASRYPDGNTLAATATAGLESIAEIVAAGPDFIIREPPKPAPKTIPLPMEGNPINEGENF